MGLSIVQDIRHITEPTNTTTYVKERTALYPKAVQVWKPPQPFNILPRPKQCSVEIEHTQFSETVVWRVASWAAFALTLWAGVDGAVRARTRTTGIQRGQQAVGNNQHLQARERSTQLAYLTPLGHWVTCKTTSYIVHCGKTEQSFLTINHNTSLMELQPSPSFFNSNLFSLNPLTKKEAENTTNHFLFNIVNSFDKFPIYQLHLIIIT